jgi:hypothetical protein
MSKLSLKGIVLGGLTDIGASGILGFPVIAFLMAKIDLIHTPKEQVQAAVQAALHANTPLYLLQLLIGAACSVLGGYVGARLAKHDELLNGSLTSFLCVALGIYTLVTRTGSASPLLEVAGFVASPALGLLGGYLRLSQKRRPGQPEPVEI